MEALFYIQRSYKLLGICSTGRTCQNLDVQNEGSQPTLSVSLKGDTQLDASGSKIAYNLWQTLAFVLSLGNFSENCTFKKILGKVIHLMAKQGKCLIPFENSISKF